MSNPEERKEQADVSIELGDGDQSDDSREEARDQTRDQGNTCKINFLLQGYS